MAGADNDAIWAALREMDLRYSALLTTFQWQLHQERLRHESELQSVKSEVQLLLARTLPRAVDTGLIRTAKPALAFMAEAAREAIHALGLGSDVTSLLDEPLDSRNIAHAYDLTRQHEVGGTQRGRALRHIRDTLVLKECMAGGPWTTDTLKDAMEEVFDRSLDDAVTSHMVLSFVTMCRLGRDREAFDLASKSMYGKTLDAGKAETLFAAYRYCAITSPDFQSKTKQNRPNPRPGKRKKDTATASATTESATPATPPESATSATPAAPLSSTADLEPATSTTPAAPPSSAADLESATGMAS